MWDWARSMLVEEMKSYRSVKYNYSKSTEEFMCKMCPSVFKRQIQLKEHMKDHNIKCLECTKIFDFRDYLITHMQEEHQIDIYRDFICESCHEIFNNRQFLKDHNCPGRFK